MSVRHIYFPIILGKGYKGNGLTPFIVGAEEKGKFIKELESPLGKRLTWLEQITDWIFISPQNSYAEILTPSVMASGGGAFGRPLCYENGALTNGTGAFIKRDTRSFLSLYSPPYEDTVRRQLSTNQEEIPSSLDILGSDFLASTTSRNKCLLFKPPSRCYSVPVAWTG